MAKAEIQRYSSVAVLLHWAIAMLIAANLTAGWFLETVSPAVKTVLMPLHISCGISVLALTVLRVLWRVLHAPPAMEDGRPVEHVLAHLVHLGLYVGMVLLPLTGWAILSAHPAPGSAGYAVEQAHMAKRLPVAPAGGATLLPPRQPGMMAWGLVPVPAIGIVQHVGDTAEGLSAQKRLHDTFADWHSLGAIASICLLVLHLAGVIKHQFFDFRASLARMWF